MEALDSIPFIKPTVTLLDLSVINTHPIYVCGVGFENKVLTSEIILHLPDDQANSLKALREGLIDQMATNVTRLPPPSYNNTATIRWGRGDS